MLVVPSKPAIAHASAELLLDLRVVAPAWAGEEGLSELRVRAEDVGLADADLMQELDRERRRLGLGRAGRRRARCRVQDVDLTGESAVSTSQGDDRSAVRLTREKRSIRMREKPSVLSSVSQSSSPLVPSRVPLGGE